MQKYIYKAEIKKIIGVNAIDIEVDLGFYVKITKRFRLVGCEPSEPGITEYLTTLLEKYKNYLYLESRKLGRYGRYDAIIYAIQDPIHISINTLVQKYIENGRENDD